ncbi:MAG: MBL fold metallo-hydrolase [Phycisphaerales bacterium]
MRYHQIRNATCVLELGRTRILVDPMLGDPGTLPPYSVIRSKARRNPLTPLPENWESLLDSIDACLVSHVHYGVDCDHLDRAGAAWLRDRGIPVFCRAGDERGLRKRGLEASPVSENAIPLLDGSVEAVRTSHGRGVVGKLMGPGAGYVIEFPGEPVVYLTGDTVLTETVTGVLTSRKPDICVVPGGGARLDIGGPVLMNLRELEQFARLAPARVVINHIGALNHCPTTRDDIHARLSPDLLDKVRMPKDGESVTFTASQ